MEIPKTFIENQEQGLNFYKNLANDFDSLQSVAIHQIIADNSLSYIEKSEQIDNFKIVIDELLNEIDKKKNLFLDTSNLRFRHIQNIYEDEMMKQEKELLDSTNLYCQSFNSIDFNMDLIKKISKNAVSIEDNFPKICQSYYNIANEILLKSFHCFMDKSKAKEYYGTYTISYAIFDNNNNEIIKTEYGFINEKLN